MTAMNNPRTESPGNRLLCVEDDLENCEALASILATTGYDVTIATTVDEGYRLARERAFDLIVLDNWFKDGSGIELCRRIRELDSDTPIIFYSAAAFETDAQEGLTVGAQEYIFKPEFGQFQQAVARILQSRTKSAT